MSDNLTLNSLGQWVPSIPLPMYGLGRNRCACGKGFWTLNGYRGHYAYHHILHPASKGDQ